MRSLALLLLLCCSAAAWAESEPSLADCVAAAMQQATRETADQAPPQQRARRSHWAPVVRVQAGTRDDERARTGQFRGFPILENDQGAGRTWSVSASWDLAQLFYAAPEGALSLAAVQLAKARHAAAQQVARLWVERARLQVALRTAPARLEPALALLATTAELDALTGGLLRPAVARAQAQVDALLPPEVPR